MLKNLKAGIGRYVSQYTPLGQLFLFMGCAALVVDAGMSYAFGISMSKWHAIGFALCAFFLAFLPDAAYREHEHGRKGTAAILGLLCVPLGIVAYYTHVGYTVGQRVMDSEGASVQNVKYEDNRDSVEEGKRSLKVAEQALKDLETANAWAPTVTATALRAKLESADKAVELEGSRGGCKTRCLAMMQERDGIKARVAILEQRDELTKRIEAARNWVKTARDQAGGVTKRVSQATNQNKFVSQLVLAYAGADTEAALNPDASTQNFVQIFISAMVALVGIIMAPVGMFVAGRNRKGFAEIANAAREMVRSTPVYQQPVPGHAAHRETIIVKDTDRRAMDEIARFKASINGALNRRQATA